MSVVAAGAAFAAEALRVVVLARGATLAAAFLGGWTAPAVLPTEYRQTGSPRARIATGACRSSLE